MAEYKLSHVLYGHSVDVRGLACTADSKVISASRDKTAKLWKLEGFNPDAILTFEGQANYVSCACVLPPNSTYPEGVILTGSNDHSIFAFSPVSGEILYKITGHTNAVCCLWSCSDGRILSSSWDATARVWQGQNQVALLEGHQASVWAVTELPESKKIITASADKTIKVWSHDVCEQTLKGHEDCVRGLAARSAAEFYSCANDATVRLWRVTGECLGIFYGHSNYIYSVSVLQGGGFVTSGEDQAVIVWKENGEHEQKIKIPAQSVWAVICLPNGDIAAGSSDGAVRVFSKEESRQASADSLTTFEQEVASFGSTKKEEIGGFKVNDLPGPEVLMAPGTRDGQTTMIREEGKVFCYEWSQSEMQWKKIGEAVGAPPPAEGKTSYQGRDYDFVFSVDVQEGQPPLKLPYNKGEDPWVAAQKFIHDNDLSQMFLDTIAGFIVKNSGATPTPAPAASGYVDPFTGGSRYVPSGAGPSTNVTSANPDPFTGGSSYTSTAARQALGPNLPVVREYHLFEQSNLDGLAVKLKEFNTEAWKPLEEEEINMAVRLAVPGEVAEDVAISKLRHMLTWKTERLFPVLDLVRLAVRNDRVNQSLCAGEFAPILLSSVLRPCLTTQAHELSRLMALRVAVNMLAHTDGEELATKNAEYFLSIANQLSMQNSNPTPRQQIALTTLLFNLSVASLRGHPELTKLMLPITALVLPRLTDIEAKRRCLRTLSNLFSQTNIDLNSIKDKKLNESLAALMGEPSVSDIAGQILGILP